MYGYIIHIVWLENFMSDLSLLGYDKCPFCYGTSLCSALKEGKADLKVKKYNFSLLSALLIDYHLLILEIKLALV